MSSSVTKSAEKRRAYHAKWWAANKDRIRATLRCRPEYRYKALELRCKRIGVKFKISFKNYLKKIKGGCYYCQADISNEIGGGVDRRNNNIRDYTARNLVACCKMCNKVKSNMLSGAEMIVAMRAVNKFRKLKKKK